MYQAQTDLTLNEVLTDPLIRAVMRADGVQMADFKSLLQTAARGIRQREPAKAPTRQAEAGSMEESLFAGRKRRLLAMIKPPGGASDAMCVGCY
jgi:hypothetical protein